MMNAMAKTSAQAVGVRFGAYEMMKVSRDKKDEVLNVLERNFDVSPGLNAKKDRAVFCVDTGEPQIEIGFASNRPGAVDGELIQFTKLVQGQDQKAFAYAISPTLKSIVTGIRNLAKLLGARDNANLRCLAQQALTSLEDPNAFVIVDKQQQLPEYVVSSRGLATPVERPIKNLDSV